MIFIAFILAIAIPISTGHRRRHGWRRSDNTQQCLKDLCSEIDRSDECWNILKSESHEFDDSDEKGIAKGVIDMAIAKSKEIHDRLNHYHSDSRDDKLKEKYHACSKNYNNASRNLVVVRRNLDSGDHYRNIHVQLDGAKEELKKCKREFREGRFDPGHVGDRNKELGIYLDIVRVATDRLARDNDRDHH
ncbi:hypothetical protein C2S53_016990 [Perilla frutescens var. hirtella]|uniref:Pectinesterase inhibitor domain-containing protein n=1 Tax=Perilla frutescens var. hirtella TaxID=608512 RepID=A0AAD4ISF8_PERFH|nr:hypothetical protein C2S53_016990 [Perilla frutescens var. hirtella]